MARLFLVVLAAACRRVRDEPRFRRRAGLGARPRRHHRGRRRGRDRGASPRLKTGLTPLAIAGAVALLAGVVLVVGGAQLILVPHVAGLAALPRSCRSCWCSSYVCAWTLVQAVAAKLETCLSMPVVIAAASEFDFVGRRTSRSRRRVADPRDALRLVVLFAERRGGRARGRRGFDACERSGAGRSPRVQDGFGVLAFDAGGHGRSEGRAMDFGWYGDEDVRAAVALVRGTGPGADANRHSARSACRWVAKK